jgi:hypothetical protein
MDPIEQMYRELELRREDLFHAESQLAEMQAEYDGECALFGDAGPGAAHPIARVRSWCAQEALDLDVLELDIQRVQGIRAW